MKCHKNNSEDFLKLHWIANLYNSDLFKQVKVKTAQKYVEWRDMHYEMKWTKMAKANKKDLVKFRNKCGGILTLKNTSKASQSAW